MPITITKKLPIINGYVSVPDRQNLLRASISNVLNAITGSELIKLNTVGTDYDHIQLPAYNAPGFCSEDYFAMIRAIAE